MTEQKIALVTGGARSMGAAIAKRLSEDGYRVFVWDLKEIIDSEDAKWLQKHPEIQPMVVDVSSEKAVRDGIALIENQSGNVSCLVNNAAISPKYNGYRAAPSETTLEEWDQVMAVNLRGPFLVSMAVLPKMIKNGWGRIINISSSSGRQGARIAGLPYGVSKTGINGLTRTLAVDVGKYGITVNSIAPGRVATPMSERSATEVQEWSRSKIPIGREGTVTDIAGLVSYLGGEESGYITGATIDINGGSYMAP